MNLKLGDWVKAIDEEVEGEIIQISTKEVIIIDSETGFESTYFLDEIIPKQQLDVEFVQQKDESINIQKPTQKNQTNFKEIDLHIGHLVDFTKGLSNSEMLDIQKKTIRSEIQQAIQTKTKRLIFIHGHGKGILKQELYKILNQHKKQLHYFDASYQKYKLGATEVEFF